MPVLFDITHTTHYRYAQPVQLGEHQLLFRPRGSHDLRVLASDLQVFPPAQDIRLILDVYSNSVAIVQPQSEANELRFVATFTVEHTGTRALDLPLDARAKTHPFHYTEEERIALYPYLQPFYTDPGGRLAQWASQFTAGPGQKGSRDLLVEMNSFIRGSMAYEVREQEGVQTPFETLDRQCGTCRDFATLMIEAARSLGYAARFVSGYVHTPWLDNDDPSAGATHAWLQAYLPGAGWIPFDPTNNLVGGSSLIRVGVGRHASSAMPVSGSWVGRPADYLGMTVDVQVRKR